MAALKVNENRDSESQETQEEKRSQKGQRTLLAPLRGLLSV